MHVVELVRRDPVVVGHGVVRQVPDQLLQRRVLERSGFAGVASLPPLVVGEEHHRIVLGGIVVLVGTVEWIDAGGEVPERLVSGTVH